jgi:hypothetical protein
MNSEVPPLFFICHLTTEKLGVERVMDVLHTCDWTSPADETDSLGSLQEAHELDFELNGFDDDHGEEGSEEDVEYMERMMAMLLNARGICVMFGVDVEMGQEMNLEERKRFARRTVEAIAKMS